MGEPMVAEAEIRIGVGMITPHMDTGFSGGAKIVLPGVCSCLTVDAFHSRQAKIAGNQLGVVEAPMRIELETGRAEDPVACALAVPIVRMKERIRICLVSAGLSLYDANQMGFGYYDSVGAAFDDVLNDQAKQPAVGVLTHGGVTCRSYRNFTKTIA
jgi:nickel-dependent lactate racemase